MKIKLKHLVEDLDRHGNVRYYVRVPGISKVRIREVPGSTQFMEAYNAAIANREGKQHQNKRTLSGSFRFLCQGYFASNTFKALDASTQAWRRRALDSICKEHADKPVAFMEPRHVRKIRDQKAGLPGAANTRLKALRALFSWAVEAEEAPHDPTRGVKAIRYLTKGHHSWSLDEVTTYEQRHPIGTKARLAMAILLYTACRREDAVRLGPQHVRDGRVRYTQAKNEHRNPVRMDIPLHPDLRTIIEATPSGNLTFLVTEYGKSFSPAGFGNLFREWCNQAGLPHCSAHGLRKATAARLAERGATAHEIMSITGHRTLEEVERYTRAVSQAKLADSAMAKLK